MTITRRCLTRDTARGATLLGAAALLGGCVTTGDLQCDQVGHWAPQVLSVADGRTVALKSPQRSCAGKAANGRSQSATLRGLNGADGAELVPMAYTTLIPLNTQLSLVQRDNLNGVPDADDGWYLYRHGRGQGEKLPWTRFEVIAPRQVAPLPGVVIAVGSDAQARGEGLRRLGYITSYMDEVRTLPDTLGHPVMQNIDFQARLRGERHAVEVFRNNAVVVHGPQGSQIYNLQGEAITPMLADLQLFGRGRDAATTLMKTRHRDLPQAERDADIIEGESQNTVYMPLDHNGQVMPLPEGAVGVMWIPSGQQRSDAFVSGWALVYPKGAAVEVAVGLGDLPSVVRQAESLPRYAGLQTGHSTDTLHRVLVKLPDRNEWLSLNSRTLRVDERSQRAPQPGALWAQARQQVAAQQQAERQRAAERQAELQRYRDEEAQRLQAAAARASAALDALRVRADAGHCDHELRAAAGRLDAETARRFFNNCGIYSAEDFANAAQAGVDSNRLANARAEQQRRNAPLEAQRARNAGLAALANAMKFRNEDNTWVEVRVYDRNGNYQGQRTMTRNQANTIGAKP